MGTTTIQVKRSALLKRNISILSSSKITRLFTQADYINNHIPTTTLNFVKNKKDYVVGFSNNDCLDQLKQHILHPYHVSRLSIKDLILHINKSDNLVIISNNKTQYHALLIDSSQLCSTAEFIPVEFHKLEF